MSTGSRTQASFIQGKQSTVDQDAPHSALIYLFQEVSRLASPVHDRGAPFMVKEDGDLQSCSISNSSCQHSLSCLSNYNQMEKMKQESHSSKDTTLVNLHPQCNSPWKVLSLINLQCERLLNPGDVEDSGQSFASSVTKSGSSTDKALTKTEQSSNVPNEMHKIPAVVRPGTDVSEACSRDAEKPQCCVKKDSQTTENTPRSELVEDQVPASSLPQPGHTEEETLSESRQINLKHECDSNIFHLLLTGSNSSFHEKEDTCDILSKPAPTLDHNANITFTPESQSDKQPSPLSVILSAAQSLLLNTAENDQSLSQSDDKPTASTLDRFNAPSEAEFLPVAQPETSSESGERRNLLDPASPGLESRSGHQEEAAPVSARTWRTKTPRKQRYPSKSVDIQDPDFQGVTFRMDTELDDSKEQCRLLITSKYSREFRKSVRKPRLRTRTALKSLKTISSEEESDPGTSASKGKVCASCCTRKTPMWRDAEDGTPLCNACGIRFKKYRVRCVNCWHIPRKESNSSSCCLKCGNSLKLTSAHRKHSA